MNTEIENISRFMLNNNFIILLLITHIDMYSTFIILFLCFNSFLLLLFSLSLSPLTLSLSLSHSYSSLFFLFSGIIYYLLQPSKQILYLFIVHLVTVAHL